MIIIIIMRCRLKVRFDLLELLTCILIDFFYNVISQYSRSVVKKSLLVEHFIVVEKEELLHELKIRSNKKRTIGLFDQFRIVFLFFFIYLFCFSGHTNQ